MSSSRQDVCGETLARAQIITWAVTSLVEGVVDNQLPPLIGVVERRVGQFTDIPEQHDT